MPKRSKLSLIEVKEIAARVVRREAAIHSGQMTGFERQEAREAQGHDAPMLAQAIEAALAAPGTCEQCLHYRLVIEAYEKGELPASKILAASGSAVTACLDSSLCECGREHEPGEVNPAESPSRKSRLELRLEDAHWARYRFSERNCDTNGSNVLDFMTNVLDALREMQVALERLSKCEDSQ